MTIKSDEFEIIRSLFAPLASGDKGALELRDDVAVLSSHNLIITKDVLVAGVHFRVNDPMDLVARKLMRVNISDLVAKGGRPTSYILGCIWPQKTPRAQLESFVSGLLEDQKNYRCTLIGGDTVRHGDKDAPLTLSATFLGVEPIGGIVPRNEAALGDDLYVTGTIGDSGLGLRCLENQYRPPKVERDYLSGRYWLPEPRVTFGSALKTFASAAMDVSDGLIADAGHLADASDIGLILEAETLPISEPAQTWLGKQPDLHNGLAALASFGDDYEILFTAPSSLRRSVGVAAKASRTDVTRIGRVVRGGGVEIVDGDGNKIRVESRGYNHFA